MSTPSGPVQRRDVRLEGAFVELTMAANRTQDPALCGVYVQGLLLRRKYTLREIEEGLASTFTLSPLPVFLSIGTQQEPPLLRETRPLVQLVAIASEEYPDPQRIRAVLEKTAKKWVGVILCRMDIELGLSTFRTSARTEAENLERLSDAVFIPHQIRAHAVEEKRRWLRMEHETAMARGLARWISTQSRTVDIPRIDTAIQTRALLAEQDQAGVEYAMAWLDRPYNPLWQASAVPANVSAIGLPVSLSVGGDGDPKQVRGSLPGPSTGRSV